MGKEQSVVLWFMFNSGLNFKLIWTRDYVILYHIRYRLVQYHGHLPYKLKKFIAIDLKFDDNSFGC